MVESLGQRPNKSKSEFAPASAPVIKVSSQDLGDIFTTFEEKLPGCLDDGHLCFGIQRVEKVGTFDKKQPGEVYLMIGKQEMALFTSNDFPLVPGTNTAEYVEQVGKNFFKNRKEILKEVRRGKPPIFTIFPEQLGKVVSLDQKVELNLMKPLLQMAFVLTEPQPGPEITWAIKRPAQLPARVEMPARGTIFERPSGPSSETEGSRLTRSQKMRLALPKSRHSRRNEKRGTVLDFKERAHRRTRRRQDDVPRFPKTRIGKKGR